MNAKKHWVRTIEKNGRQGPYTRSSLKTNKRRLLMYHIILHIPYYILYNNKEKERETMTISIIEQEVPSEIVFQSMEFCLYEYYQVSTIVLYFMDFIGYVCIHLLWLYESQNVVLYLCVFLYIYLFFKRENSIKRYTPFKLRYHDNVILLYNCSIEMLVYSYEQFYTMF